MSKQMKKSIAFILSLVLVFGAFAGCAGSEKTEPEAPANFETQEKEEEATAPEEPEITEEPELTGASVKVAGMKGPTGIGMVNLMDAAAKGETKNEYEFVIEGAPDLITGKVITGEVDIAAVPVNLASILYNKTEKDITLLGVNALGVVYILADGVDINSLEDLKGKDIYATGQGATPEYVLRYVLEEQGINPDEDVNIVFESEATALQAKMVAGEVSIAMIPEPFVSVITSQKPEVKVALDLTKEWEKATDGKVLTTGGVIVRNEFLNANPDAVKIFMEEYGESCKKAVEDIDGTAKLVVENEIIGKEEVAKTAIPRSNIVFLTGEEMKTAVEQYYEVLFASNPQSIGGTTPDAEFFYQG